MGLWFWDTEGEILCRVPVLVCICAMSCWCLFDAFCDLWAKNIACLFNPRCNVCVLYNFRIALSNMFVSTFVSSLLFDVICVSEIIARLFKFPWCDIWFIHRCFACFCHQVLFNSVLALCRLSLLWRLAKVHCQ